MGIILSYNINFNVKALKNSEEDYEKIKFTTNQFKLIEDISYFLNLFIWIPESAIRRIICKALREWLFKNNLTIAQIEEMAIGSRLNAVKEIFYMGRKLIKRMLKEPDT
ncbi:MAG: hypothetical protein ACFE92_00190 [Promethearchaeota archaeon]